MMKKLLLLLFLAGCGGSENTPKPQDSANSTNHYYKGQSGSPVDPNQDDIILDCLEVNGKKTGLCESNCISNIFPEYVRYDAWFGNITSDNNCSYYIFESGAGARYWFYWDKSYKCSNVNMIDYGLFILENPHFLKLFDLNGNLKTQYTLFGSGGLSIFQVENWSEYQAWITCKKYDDLLKAIQIDLPLGIK